MSEGIIAGLVLAAGESRRMGRDKALLEFQGRSFLEVILENLSKSGIARRYVVLGYHAGEIQKAACLEGAEVVINADYRLGQTSSLQAGLCALDISEVEGVLLCLVDHPAATADVMQRLVSAFRETSAPVVIPMYSDRRGHPVLIGRPLFAELTSLDPRQGANTVLQKYRDLTHWLKVDDAGVLLDIDKPEDYQNLRGE